MKKEKNFFGGQLRKIMFEKHITQKELADKMGIVQQMVSFWVTGRNVPTLASLKKLSSFFDVPVNYFMEENYSKNSSDKKNEKYLSENILLKEKVKRLETEISLLKKEMELMKLKKNIASALDKNH